MYPIRCCLLRYRNALVAVVLVAGLFGNFALAGGVDRTGQLVVDSHGGGQSFLIRQHRKPHHASFLTRRSAQSHKSPNPLLFRNSRKKTTQSKREPYYHRKVMKSGLECAKSSSTKAQVLSSSQRKPGIPRVLVLTGKNESFNMITHAAQANIMNLLKMDPSMKLRWLGDRACAAYLKEHYDAEILGFFISERHGSRRGDLCRTAVLLREGGFYIDLDVVLKVPLQELVDDTTTFMSVYEDPDHEEGGILNALIATEAGSTILNNTMDEFRKWYRGQVSSLDSRGDYHWMGPTTLKSGLLATMDTDCPCEDFEKRREAFRRPGRHPIQWSCGPHTIRLYAQKKIRCGKRGKFRDPAECSSARAKSKFWGSRFGLFEPGPHRKLIGWTRPETCRDSGCNLGGWDESSFLQTNEARPPSSWSRSG